MIFNIDFDGTVVTHEFPKIGKDIGAVPILKKLIEAGHHLILFTMRSNFIGEPGPIGSIGSGKHLDDAIDWFNKNNIPLYGIQTNPTQHTWTNSPKSYAEIMIDDSALGCPLIYNEKISKRPYVDWIEIEKILINNKII